MESICIALIGFIGVIIGAVISSFVTWKIGKQTQKTELEKQKVDFYNSRIRDITEVIKEMKLLDKELETNKNQPEIFKIRIYTDLYDLCKINRYLIPINYNKRLDEMENKLFTEWEKYKDQFGVEYFDVYINTLNKLKNKYDISINDILSKY